MCQNPVDLYKRMEHDLKFPIDTNKKEAASYW